MLFQKLLRFILLVAIFLPYKGYCSDSETLYYALTITFTPQFSYTLGLNTSPSDYGYEEEEEGQSLTVDIPGKISSGTVYAGSTITGGIILKAADSINPTSVDFEITLQKNGAIIGGGILNVPEDNSFNAYSFSFSTSESFSSDDDLTFTVSAPGGSGQYRSFKIDTDYPELCSLVFPINTTPPPTVTEGYYSGFSTQENIPFWIHVNSSGNIDKYHIEALIYDSLDSIQWKTDFLYGPPMNPLSVANGSFAWNAQYANNLYDFSGNFTDDTIQGNFAWSDNNSNPVNALSTFHFYYASPFPSELIELTGALINDSLPVLENHPGAVSATVGTRANFSVEASGLDLSFQWQENETDISGETSSIIAIPAVSANDNNSSFRCVVSNETGSVISNAAVLTVETAAPPLAGYYFGTTSEGYELWLHVDSNFQIYEFKYSAKVFDYWGNFYYKTASTNFFAPGFEIPVTGNSFDHDSRKSAEDDSTLFSGIFNNNGYGASGQISWANYAPTPEDSEKTLVNSWSVLHETLSPPALIQHPADLKIKIGKKATFNSKAIGYNLSYQWQKDGENIQGATNPVYTFTPIEADQNAVFQCVVSNGNGSDISTPATLTIGFLKLEEVDQTLGELGFSLTNKLIGQRFDSNTSVAMYLDSGNRRQIIGSLEIEREVYDVLVVENTAFVIDSGQGLSIVDITSKESPFVMGQVDTWFQSHGIAVSGNYAYMVDDASLHVVAISDFNNPQIAQSLGSIGWPQAVTVSGNYAYIADGNGGLKVVNITTPTDPSLVASLDSPGESYGLAIAGDYVYLADGSGGLQIIDVSTPETPELKGFYSVVGSARRVVIDQTTAYLASEDGGLFIIDVQDPTTPELIGSLDTPGSSYGLSKSGDTIYLADGYSGLQSINISNPAIPTQAGTVNTPGFAYNVFSQGGFAFVADGVSGLKIINQSESNLSFKIGGVKTAGLAKSIAISGDFAFLADGLNGLLVFNITDPASPSLIKTIDTPGSAERVRINGSYVYLVDGTGGIQIIDMSKAVDTETPSEDAIVAEISTSGQSYDIAFAGSVAFVAEGENGVRGINIVNPLNPQPLPNSISNFNSARGLAISEAGTTLFVADYGDETLHSININNPFNPVPLHKIATGFSAVEVIVQGNYAYVAKEYDFYDLPGDTSGMQIIDISDPADLQVSGSLMAEPDLNSLFVSGNYAYLANSGYGLQVVDITDQTAPVITFTLPTPFTALGLAVKDNIAYVADGSGLAVVPLPIDVTPITVDSDTLISTAIPSPTLPGDYTLRVYNGQDFDDLSGAITFSSNQDILHARAIIVSGDTPTGAPDIWNETDRSARFAYESLRRQGYSSEDIYYIDAKAMTAQYGEIVTPVTSIVDSIGYAINTWATQNAQTSDLVIFFTGHGENEVFKINNAESLSATLLDGWLDDLQTTLQGRVVFIYDACQSGSFLGIVQPEANSERIVITSTTAEESAWFRDNNQSFSYQFWTEIFLGSYLDEAFYTAKNTMLSFQTAMLDTDGDGDFDLDDRDSVNNVSISRAFMTSSGRPVIRTISGDINLNGQNSAAIIWAEGVFSPAQAIVGVWAEIISPDFAPALANTPGENVIKLALSGPDNAGRYQADYSNFTTRGSYIVSIFAEDDNGIISMPYTMIINQSIGDDLASPDQFEQDELSSQAVVVSVNDYQTQRHNFHTSGDTDWIKFYGLSGNTYRIKTSNLSSLTDTVVSIYDVDGSTLLNTINNGAIGEDEELEWTLSENGTFYAKITNSNTHFGETATYSLEIDQPVGPLFGWIFGSVKDADSGDSIQDASIQIELQPDSVLGGTISAKDGKYCLAYTANTYRITASANGFDSKTFTGIEINENNKTEVNFNLTPYSQPNEDVNLYIQNETFTNIKEFTTTNSITVGENVTDTKTTGPVYLESGADVTLKSKQILLKPGVHVKQNSKLHIMVQE